MRRISLLFIFCLIFVSCRLPESGLYFSSNPFLEAKTIVSDESEIVFLKMLGRLTSFQNSMYLETLGNHDWHPYNYRAEDVASFWYGSVFDTGNHMTYAEKLLEGLEINEE